jgi:iron(III) transport system permease protein
MSRPLPVSALTPRPAGARRPRRPPVWTLLALPVAALVASPVLAVLVAAAVPAGDVWRHIAATTLPEMLGNSVLLVLLVGAMTASCGAVAAWLVTACRFPGSRALDVALLLPMAMPAYVCAYAYTWLLDVAGPAQTALRDLTGLRWGQYWFPEIRSLPGAAVVLAMVLYPYVYLLCRGAFQQQSVCLVEASRTLGHSLPRCFLRLALPLARPAIVGGVALALMETLADFGTVQHFGVSTFTTGIYRTWFALGEPTAAAQLAAALMLFVLMILAFERWSRRFARYVHTATSRPRPSYRLRGGPAALALLACMTPVALGFGVPVAVLSGMSLESGDALLGDMFVELASNSFVLATLAALITVGFAVIVAYGLRLRATPLMRGSARIAALGYAIPGAVIAVGVLIPFARFDNALDAWLRASFGISTGLLLTGTIAGLLFAYLVRFLALAFNTVDAGLVKINRNLDDAARVLGQAPSGTLLRVHMPLIWSSLLTALILVFVDVLKELPATLILRPFDFETLAVRVYRFASDERLAEASSAALAIVAVGLLPVILLSRAITRTAPASRAG